jgi:hypothetical protein
VAAAEGAWRGAASVKVGAWTLAAFGALALWLAFANYGFAGGLMGGAAGTGFTFAAERLRALCGVFVDYPGLGAGAGAALAAIPALAVAALLHALAIPADTVGRLMLALYFFIALSGARALGRALTAGEEPRVREAVATAGALLYCVNHYTLQLFGTVATFAPLAYVALPWILAGIVDGCERAPRRGIATIAVALLVASGGAVNDPATFGVALLIVPLGALFMLAGGAAPRRVAAVAGAGLALGVALCAWWLLPAATAPHVLAAGSDASTAGATSASSATFVNVLALSGSAGAGGLAHAAWYALPLGALLGYAPLLLALVGFGVVRRRFGAAALIAFAAAAFLAKAAPSPGSCDAWTQLEALLLVVLYDSGLAGLLYRARSALRSARSFLLAVAACALPVVLYPWPAYGGAMLQAPPDPLSSFHATIPADYVAVADYLRAHSGAERALVLNAGGAPLALYTWGYFGADPLPALAGVAVATPDAVPRAAVLPPGALAAALDALAVRYVVVHDDLRNPAPAADIATLVRHGDAALVLRTHDLRVFERRAAPGTTALVHGAALIAAGPADDAELRADPLETAQLVPDVAPALPQPATLLASVRGTAQPGDAALGTATVAAAGTATGAVLGNPFVALAADGRCGARSALRLVSPSRWWAGAAALPSFDAAFCLAHPRLSLPFVDGSAADAGSRIVAFSPRRVHDLQVLEAVRGSALVAHALPDDGLTFAFTAPFAGDALLVRVPPALLRVPLFASVLASDGAVLGSGSSAGGASEFLLPIAARTPLPGEVCFVTLHGSDRTFWPAIRATGTLRVFLATSTTERFGFRVPAAALAARALDARADGALRERVANGAATFAPSLWLRPQGQSGGTWSASGPLLDARSRGTALDLTANGRLLPTDAYALRVAYTASGDAALRVRLDGYAAERTVPLVADGRLHELAVALHPPTGASGAFQLHAAMHFGTLRAHVALATSGPNALLYALSSRSTGGTLDTWGRRAPWWFDAHVAGCAPCVLRVAVGDLGRWVVLGAANRGTYEGAGGAATWVLDAGAASTTVTLLFWPALLAGCGLAVALVALALGAFPVRRMSAVTQDAQREPYGAPFTRTDVAARAALAGALVALAFLAAAQTDAVQTAGDVLGFAICCAIAVLGIAATARSKTKAPE